MESIIKEIEMMLELPMHERQKAYFQDLLNAAKPVTIVPAADVLEDYELDYIRHVIKPKPKECYRNSHLLCEAFPERILYCEGKTNVPIPIDHAFNKVGDAYIDITFEFALHENPSIYEYVTFGEYDAKTIRKAVLETGYYGEIYKCCIIRVRNKKTPGVINQYTPGELYTVTESDIWLMRYCKGRLKIRLSNAPRKNDFRNKDIFLENR